MLTLHIGSAARETKEEMAMRTVDNLETMIQRKGLLNCSPPKSLATAPWTQESYRLDKDLCIALIEA